MNSSRHTMSAAVFSERSLMNGVVLMPSKAWSSESGQSSSMSTSSIRCCIGNMHSRNNFRQTGIGADAELLSGAERSPKKPANRYLV